ncbi:inositol monophosphatase family protein [Sphingomonas sp. BIUV-7]|uniref:Inositol monophosphatase family protein n=1 Tax=Sphingomonas natans TaxID=3063330 RepID=A0ABT8Y4A1_9SPHN|nr:inositol monophosphatase family protein [Sphingomonas sp. BIUV-7]MDO6413136.1 inositol monophosphatase family protein [Sphingomonas sp. BIUV-7]
MSTALIEPVAALMRQVAAEVVMPRFRALAAHEVIEKGPGDLVTVADRESELRLGEGLAKILPEARMIGEEAVSADASLLDGIGEGLAWIVDPIDGTSNFAEGITPFAIMIALIGDGDVQASWILDPVTGRLLHAVQGGGAFVNGERVTTRPTGKPLPVAALATQFLPSEVRADFEARTPGRLENVSVPRCAGEQYPRVVLGQNDAALFWRAHPWDHAPGALILTEAGGRIARFDGVAYRPGVPGLGLIAAATPALWDEIRQVLLG